MNRSALCASYMVQVTGATAERLPRAKRDQMDTSDRMSLQHRIEHAADLIRQADAIVVGAGAGMGVDSGLPDFRGVHGFWRAYPALGQRGIRFESIASPDAFRQWPRLAWGFYGHRLRLYRETQPHKGFDLIRAWAADTVLGVSVFTSNVDGQFQRAGFPLDAIHECHGSIHHLQCLEACSAETWPASDFEPEVDTATGELCNAEMPRCPRCGALARPNILMFGDPDWIEGPSLAQSRRQERWLAGVSRPVVIEIGAGTAIPSVRYFSHEVLHRHGGRLIRINPADFSVPTPRDVGLPMGALDALTAIALCL